MWRFHVIFVQICNKWDNSTDHTTWNASAASKKDIEYQEFWCKKSVNFYVNDSISSFQFGADVTQASTMASQQPPVTNSEDNVPAQHNMLSLVVCPFWIESWNPQNRKRPK